MFPGLLRQPRVSEETLATGRGRDICSASRCRPHGTRLPRDHLFYVDSPTPAAFPPIRTVKEEQKTRKREGTEKERDDVPPKTQAPLFPPPLCLDLQRLDVPLPRHGGPRQREQGTVPVLSRAPVREERGGDAVRGRDCCWVQVLSESWVATSFPCKVCRGAGMWRGEGGGVARSVESKS